MRSTTFFADQQLLARLNAPPDLSDGVDSLGYWRARRRELPWYRIRARREAARMTIRWEQRVRAALVHQRGAPIKLRLSAGLLIARTRLRRWAAVGAIVLTATIAVALAAAPAIAAVAFLVRGF
jgi:hypothetical protein